MTDIAFICFLVCFNGIRVTCCLHEGHFMAFLKKPKVANWQWPEEKAGTNYSASKYQILVLLSYIPGYINLKFCGDFRTKQRNKNSCLLQYIYIYIPEKGPATDPKSMAIFESQPTCIAWRCTFPRLCPGSGARSHGAPWAQGAPWAPAPWRSLAAGRLSMGSLVHTSSRSPTQELFGNVVVLLHQNCSKRISMVSCPSAQEPLNQLCRHIPLGCSTGASPLFSDWL